MVALAPPCGGVRPVPKEAANRRVFVIDDDDDVRDSTTFLLQSEGYEVEAFSSGSAFLESVSPSYKGCVITDVRMPGMNGVELIAQMRRKTIPLPVARAIFSRNPSTLMLCSQRWKPLLIKITVKRPCKAGIDWRR